MTAVPSGWLDRLRRWYDPPCDRCGMTSGPRYVKGEIVDGRKYKRLLCSECSKDVFLHSWQQDREWVSW